MAFDPEAVELCPANDSSEPSCEVARYPVLVAEPLKRSAPGEVVPSIAMVCTEEAGVTEVGLTSTTENVVLLAEAAACRTARFPAVKGAAVAAAVSVREIAMTRGT